MVCIVGWSKTGKTSLIEGLLRELGKRGWRVAAVKHHPHWEALGPPGKDTTRFLEAGAGASVLVGPPGFEISVPLRGATLEELLPWLSGFDLVIAEGFKGSPYPKIEVRGGEGPLQPGIEGVVGVVGEAMEGESLPRFSPEEVGALADFIEDRFLKGKGREVEVFSDGRAVPLNRFVRTLLHGLLQGVIRALKGCEDSREVIIRWRSL